MLYAAIDIHKCAFQAAVLDPESGEVVEERFAADRDSLARWAEPWRGRLPGGAAGGAPRGCRGWGGVGAHGFWGGRGGGRVTPPLPVRAPHAQDRRAHA